MTDYSQEYGCFGGGGQAAASSSSTLLDDEVRPTTNADGYEDLDLRYAMEGPDRMLAEQSPWFTRPPQVITELKSYQFDGVERLNHMIDLHKGALLADEVGLGKTVQTLAVICSLITRAMDRFRSRCATRSPQADETDEPLPLQLFELRKPHARARVRGEPTLIVVPLSAVAEWIRQVCVHTSGLTVALVESDERLLAYVTDTYRSEDKPRVVTGMLDMNALRSFDILLITYKRLQKGAGKLADLLKCYSNFRPFDDENRSQCRNHLYQLLNRNQLALRTFGLSANGVFDNWCRPRYPLGMLLASEQLGRRALWSLKPTLLVCDEAHMLNNPEAQITQAMLTLCASAYLMVTATPSNNHLLEFATLLMLMRVPVTLNGAEWKHLALYQRAHLLGPSLEARARLEADPVIAELQVRFKTMLQQYKLARLGKEVGVYSHFEVHRHVLKHPFVNERERQINSRVLAAAQSSLSLMLGPSNEATAEARRSVNLHFQALITRGKQVATAAAVIPWSDILPDKALGEELEQAPDLSTHGTKLRLVKALLADERRIKPTEKVIIASFFVGVLHMLEHEFGASCVLIVGDTGKAHGAQCTSKALPNRCSRAHLFDLATRGYQSHA